MSKIGKWTRRGFLTVGGVIGGGLVLGVGAAMLAPDRISRKGGDLFPGFINTWIKIAPDDEVTILVPHAEIGQGAHNALAMMAADELDADWARIVIEEAPATSDFANNYMAQAFTIGNGTPKFLTHAMNNAMFAAAALSDEQITGGSSSVRATGEYGMRVAGATARLMLISAAATHLGVPAEECTTKNSLVYHTKSGRSLRYGEIANDAAQLPIPSNPVLKSKDQWRLMGTSLPRADIPPKVNGTLRYGIDMVLPNMVYASVSMAPVFGAKLVSVDPKPAMAMPGVIKVINLADGVAVVANSWWRAQQAVLALSPVFSKTENELVNSAQMMAGLKQALAGTGKRDSHQGDGANALPRAVQIIEAQYTAPFLAHATMEPPCATAVVTGAKCEVWAGVQDPLGARAVAADALNFHRDQVLFHNLPSGGGFGRRLPGAFDYIDQAVRVAAIMAPQPVKLIWPREQDIQQDYYRPLAAAKFKAGLDAQKAPLVWTSLYVGDGGDGSPHVLYDIPHQEIDAASFTNHVKAGYWRSVEHSYQAFFTESFIDEMAHAAGADPFIYRRDRLSGRPRAVLELAALKSGWGSPMDKNQGRGIAVRKAFGTYIAEVAEVTMQDDGTPKITRVVAAVDCGDVVNPNAARAQIEGGIIFGISAALWGEITIAKGAVEQSSFPDYPVAKMADAPKIEVYFIDSGEARGGLGEPGVPPVAPAIANAIFAITGKRVRDLPLIKNLKV